VRLVAARSELQEFVRAVPLFAGLLPSELDRIALVMNPIDVAAGHVVCAEGDLGRDFYLLARGEATIERGGSTVATLHPGDHFGELALLDRGPRSATVRAAGDCRLYVLGDESLAAVLNEVPALAQKLLATLARRLRQADAQDHSRDPTDVVAPRRPEQRTSR
jgi:CRP/FNR family transcriptional regulator, cyclic AMP receptor protein